MLNTNKLLYILPDVAYVAELLPGKKPTTFKLQSFRQINGEFINEDDFIGSNILKLFNKLDKNEYQLILPDSLFTNTIVSIAEKSDRKIKEKLTEELLPDLGINTDSHQIETTVLTDYADKSKVQLSALEKSILTPVQISARESGIKIKNIIPLSWSIKSLISLEPSISVIQIGSMLYLSLHYIGLDQASQTSVDTVDYIFETIKTLKGAEPSIQTVYLLTNELVESKLKEHLSDTLPLQQLADANDNEAKMPSYLQKTIEAGMRTLSITDYPVPKFELGKALEGAIIEESDEQIDEQPNDSDLPKPEKKISSHTLDQTIDQKKEKPTKETPTTKTEEKHSVSIQHDNLTSSPNNQELNINLPPHKPTKLAIASTKHNLSLKTTAKDDEIEALLENLKSDDDQDDDQSTMTTESHKTAKKNVNSNTKTKAMLKMIFVTLVVFFATVGIGIGIGLGVLELTKSTPETINPEVITNTNPSPEPSAQPSPSAIAETVIDKKNYQVLVVNATKRAGLAGEITSLLKKDGFTNSKASNAKGDYVTGNFILLREENQTLTTSFEKATNLIFQSSVDKKVEDPKDEYDAVIVLAE